MVIVLWTMASAVAVECIKLEAAKEVYLPAETVQVEIDAEVMKDVTIKDIFLYRGTLGLPANFFISKVTGTKYFLWFDLPLEHGEYTLRVRGYCRDGRVYVANLPLKVEKSIASSYDHLRANVEDRWDTLPLEEHILSAGALSYILYDEALQTFRGRRDSCISQECNTKLNALTLMFFKDSQTRQKMIEAIEASQNYVKGTWKLQISSTESQRCNLSLNGTTVLNIARGENSFDLGLEASLGPEINVLIECEKNVNAKIINFYGAYKKEFERTGRILQFSINNRGCWGTGIRTECNNEATSYALLALAFVGSLNLNSSHAVALDWLKNKANSIEDEAIIYYITKDSLYLESILSSQSIAGWWPKDNINHEPSVKATSLVIFALKDNQDTNVQVAIEKAKDWLKARTMSLADEAFMLSFAFGYRDIEPIVAFWPGLIKVNSGESFDIFLSNKGPLGTNLNATLMNSTTALMLPVNSVKRIQFSVPLITTTDGRVLFETVTLDYSTNVSQILSTFSIPVIIFTKKSIEERVEGKINASEEEVNETEQQEIINETKKIENKTIELNESLIKKKFRFIEKDITKSVNLGDGPFVMTINLKNELDVDLEDISIERSSSLIGIVDRVNPSFIEKLRKGGSEEITIYFSPTVPRGYRGEINASAIYKGQKIFATISVTVNVSGTMDELKNCSDLGGKICKEEEGYICDPAKGNKINAKDTYSCCVPSEACRKKQDAGTLIGVIIVLVIVIILLGVLFFLKRKSRREMSEFLEEASKSYEKRFQRPATLRGQT